MPTFFRIEKRRYMQQAFDGIGGLFTAGRWHRAGVRVAYASEHHAVAMLEKLAWLGTWEDAHDGDFVVIDVEMPAEEVETLPLASLPAGWDAFPHGDAAQEIGQRWLSEGRSAALRVPSAVVPLAYNVLINPLHEARERFAFGTPRSLRWDPRLFG